MELGEVAEALMLSADDFPLEFVRFGSIACSVGFESFESTYLHSSNFN